MQLRNSAERYGLVAVLFHWGFALAVLGMFGLGLWMRSLDYYDAWYRTGPWLHKGIGVALFALLLMRFGWRLVNTAPAPLPNHSPLQRSLAHAVHVALYSLLLVLMVAGYLISTADGRPLDVFDLFEIPAVVAHKNLEDYAGKIHLGLAIVLVALAGLHALAALKHHFVDKDRTLLRMLGR